MAVSEYDKQFLTQEQQNQIAAITAAAEKSGDWTSAHNAAEAIRNSAGYSGGVNGAGYTAYTAPKEEKNSNEELLEYLKQQQAANTTANLSNLAAAYQANRNNLEAQQNALPETYAQSRNDAAAQDAISRKNFDERAVASGLSNGASGQAELSRESAYKNNIATINSSEAKSNNDIQLQMNNLQAEYENAIVAAKAEGNSALAESLYNEMVRQQNVALEQEQNALSEAKYAQSLALELGITDPATLANIKSLSDLAKVQGNAKTSASVLNGGGGYDNGTLSTSQIKEMQNYYGVTADGYWGTNSSKASGGLTAEQAWSQYSASKSGSNYNEVSSMAAQILNTQGKDKAKSYIREAYTSGAINLSEYSRLQSIIR